MCNPLHVAPAKLCGLGCCRGDAWLLQRLGWSCSESPAICKAQSGSSHLLKQALKKDGATWAAKYARGGSARKLSARKFYVAVDMLQGHLVSNAMSPMPPPKLQTLLGDLSSARQLLAEAK